MNMVKVYIPGPVVTYIPGQQNLFKYYPPVRVHVSLAASFLQLFRLQIFYNVLSLFLPCVMQVLLTHSYSVDYSNNTW